MNDDVLRRRIDEVLAQSDPERRVALSRRLRADVLDLLSEEELEKLRRSGVDIETVRGSVRKEK